MSTVSHSGDLSNLRIALRSPELGTGIRSKAGLKDYVPSNSASVFKNH